ncbi:MAG TPA: DUF4215 domain-containing protein [Candidatus Limnocylindrales bacterium]|nr:DUF4215 domain-containing protein [Candidatus Limnocylindrales bacterium]
MFSPLAATEASAQIVTDSDRCREDLSTGQRRYIERLFKARIQCETRVILGSLPPDTNCLTGRGDTAMDKRLRKAEDALSVIGRDCSGVNLSALGFPGSCPDLTGGTFDTEDFKTCVVDSTNAMLTSLLDFYYPPVHHFFRGSDAKCLNGSARNAMRSFIGSVDAREDCLLGQDFGVIAQSVKCRNEIQPYGSGTGSADVDNEIGQAYVRLLGAIPTACADVNIDDLDYQSSCIDPTGGQFTIFDLKKCLFAANRAQTLIGVNVPFPENSVCGDGVKSSSEECDDANSVNTDACTAGCKNARCGDGFVRAGVEQCDDGNSVNTDSCSNTCTTNIPAECHNGTKEGAEQCDDGNTVNTDTCVGTCMNARCGDGFVCSAAGCTSGSTGGAEACDDGNTVDTDNCKNNCTLGSPCGNGVKEGAEECDDHNSVDCDGCSALCLTEFCGDNIRCPNTEECDDGVDNSDTTPNACRTTCKNPKCGDGVTDVIANGEDCDDGNTVDTDACPNSCFICGNNKKQPGEECDGTDHALCPAGEGCLDCDCAGVCPVKGELVLYSQIGVDCTTNTDCPVGTCDQSLGRCRTATRLDSGWIGSAYDADINNEVHVTGVLSCPGSGPTCGLCNVTNVDASTGNCRCSSLGFQTLPGLGNQQICDVPFQQNVPACKECNAASGNKKSQACSATTDCLDDSPQCGKTVRVCSNSSTTVCTSDTVCTNISAGGKCLPLRSCSNEQTKSCTANADCANATAKCQSQKCSNDTTHVCASNADCQAGVCNPSKTQCRTESIFCSTNQDCWHQGDCTELGDCACYFGAPFPLSSGGVPACVSNRFSKPVSGTANVDLGSGSISASLRTQVFLGQSGNNNPCPTCGGICSTNADATCDRDLDCKGGGTCTHMDPVPNDGQRGGVCTAGQNIKLPCDVTATNTTFPAHNDGIDSGGGYSLDCFPSAGKNVSGTGLVIDLTQTTGTSTLTSHVPCGGIDALCPCLVCDGNPLEDIPCNTDEQCAALGFGACTSSGAGGFPEPNACDNRACTALPDGTGVCTTGPDEHFCDLLLRSNGKGFIPCNPDDPNVDNRGCGKPTDGAFYYGQCTLSDRRLCLPDPIVATGTPSTTAPIGAATFCIPPTANPGINNAAGLPGPGRVVNQAKARTFCDAAMTREYVPGVGCPAP